MQLVRKRRRARRLERNRTWHLLQETKMELRRVVFKFLERWWPIKRHIAAMIHRGRKRNEPQARRRNIRRRSGHTNGIFISTRHSLDFSRYYREISRSTCLSFSLSLHPSISTLRSRCVIIAYARIIYTRHVSSRGRADAIARWKN